MNYIFENISHKEYYNLVLQCILDNSIHKKDLKFYYRLFYDKKFSSYHKLKTEFLFAIRKNRELLDEELFCKALKIKKTQIEDFLNSDYKISYFPIVSKNEKKVSKLYIFELKDKISSNFFPNSPENIKSSINKVKNLLQKNFFVTFDSEDFSGSSFLLALFAGFFVKQKNLEKFLFTGDVSSDGKILVVSDIDKKAKLAKNTKKYLISYKNIKNIYELKNLNKIKINIPFIQLFNKNKIELEKNFSLLKEFLKPSDILYLSILNLESSKISIFNENPIDNSLEIWDNYLKEFKEKIKNIYNHPFEIVIHFISSLSVLAFGMGVIFGAKRKIVIYHYQDGEIFKIMDFSKQSVRILKEKKSKLDFIRYEKVVISKLNIDEVAISIYLASHDPGKDVENFVKNYLNCDVVKISLKKFQGNIPVNKEKYWIELVRELFSVIDNIDKLIDKKIKKIHLFLSVPVPIAFSLGMAIGDYKKISLYNFDKGSGDYKKVIDSEQSNYFKNFF